MIITAEWWVDCSFSSHPIIREVFNQWISAPVDEELQPFLEDFSKKHGILVNYDINNNSIIVNLSENQLLLFEIQYGN